MPRFIQLSNSQSQSGTSSFNQPGKCWGGHGGGLSSLGYDEIEQRQRVRSQRVGATGLEKEVDVDVHGHQWFNAQGQGQIVQSDRNWIDVEAEAEVEQEAEIGTSASNLGSGAQPGAGV